MKKLQGETHQTVLELPEGIKVQVNPLNWILFIPPRNYWYYSTFPELIMDLFDYKIKQQAINSDVKDIKAFRDSIENVKKEISTMLDELISIKESRLDSLTNARRLSKH